MKIDPDDFRVKEGKSVNLDKWPTKVKDYYEDKEHYKLALGQQVEELREQQDLLYASNAGALLLIFQAMDAAGKDGAIKHVMSGVNPQGVQVHSFKQPSSEELAHDFLWRAVRRLPDRGRIGIFNRSYYEEVLVVRVHSEYLERQGLKDTKSLWSGRFRSITELEKHLRRNGTRVVKFYLHVSKGEQRKRFLSRIDDAEKNWKFNMGDVKERAHWQQYMHVYGECLSATSTDEAPWYVVPADDKENARLIVAQTVVRELKDMDMEYPKLDAAQKRELAAAGKLLRKGA